MLSNKPGICKKEKTEVEGSDLAALLGQLTVTADYQLLGTFTVIQRQRQNAAAPTSELLMTKDAMNTPMLCSQITFLETNRSGVIQNVRIVLKARNVLGFSKR